MQSWTYLSDLRNGEVFKTRGGVYAVKSEYLLPNGQCECVLLASGEYATFADGNQTVVQAVHVEGCTESLGVPPPPVDARPFPATTEELRAFIRTEVRKALIDELRTSAIQWRSI